MKARHRLSIDWPILLVAAVAALCIAPADGWGQQAADRRDVLLMLDGGPLHLRLNLGLGGVSLAEARRQYVSQLVDRLDKDRDGKLTRAEAAGSPVLRMKQRAGASQFLEGLGGQSVISPRDVARTVDRLGGEPIGYRQDLTSAQNDIEVFKLLDADSSSVLDGAELAAAGDLIMSKDGDGDECVAFQEFFPPPPAPNPLQVAVVRQDTPPPPLAVADMVRDASEPLLPNRLLKKYDKAGGKAKRRDMMLDAAELSWSKERVSQVDEDGNGKLDAAELSRLAQSDPDVELNVDLRTKDAGGGDAAEGRLSIGTLDGKRLDAADRNDYAKASFGAAVVTFSLRNIDPIASAVDNALREFNTLDADANGYLDKDETRLRIRFQRELFELMDADGDAKVFADEMKQYVSARAEPAATTCRMNLYDTGYGFFMALDGNADGRVSVREMRHSAQSLGQLERDGESGVKQNEPVRHFHIEFVRGGYQLFGPSEQLLAQTPAFQQGRPTGPIWFQRMDRNLDGDLTWNEFLGPREVFHDLDGDADALIDPREAAKAR